MAWLALAMKFPLLLFRKPMFASDRKDPERPARLCNFAELPKWYQDNPFIIANYRPVSESYNACLHSLAYLHNETVNIYTHLLPAITLALALPLLQLNISRIYADAPWMDRFMLTLTPMAALGTLSLSSTYHTLMNHSPFVSSSCLLLDYTGILALILASFISGVFVGFYESEFHQWMYWSMIFGLVLTSCLFVLHPRLQGPVYRAHRTTAFILTALSGFAPVFHSIYLYGPRAAYSEKGVKWWLAEGLWYGLGATLFASRFPEKWAFGKGGSWKGRFDVWGSSHQIFHACVVAGASCHCWGVWEAWKNAV
ncbi:HlyIII-domain-containing protein [Corynespora cassiicola Philippines]|uniref:HlyIII-domain-containing protein n=1 Tax=Corynespora cassiicola Philippines TaxID=1448308 RepID=A0A2T2NY33_CORCC|nr:HlyIII-domain-containing protein [Corynespora cassiicola Philippines]